MNLNILWFVLVTVLFMGYFILEGFDFGVGILLPFLGKDDIKRRVIINTIGPHWDGNEVWLITAGGATFAAFPNWYATLFSGFYLPLFLILLALIIRGVAFEFRGKEQNPRWRSVWDWAIFTGSLLPALLWGVALANLLKGVPIDGNMNYTGGFFNLLNGYALLGGVISLLGFILQGALFLSLKVDTGIAGLARRLAWALWIPVTVLLAVFAAVTYFVPGILNKSIGFPNPAALITILAMLAVGYAIYRMRRGWAFGLTSLAIASATAAMFIELFPRVMVSSTDPAFSLTIYNAASGNYTLTVMSIVALIFLPVILAYQAWTYWIFRKRVSDKVEELHY